MMGGTEVIVADLSVIDTRSDYDKVGGVVMSKVLLLGYEQWCECEYPSVHSLVGYGGMVIFGPDNGKGWVATLLISTSGAKGLSLSGQRKKRTNHQHHRRGPPDDHARRARAQHWMRCMDSVLVCPMTH